MKIKQTIAVLAGLVLACNAYSQFVTFANGTGSVVINDDTGAPVALGLVQAGLYYSTDLNAVQDLTDPNGGAGFQLLAGSVTPVTPNTVPQFAGRFSGGNVTFPDATPVTIQALVWSVGYATYAEALGSTDALVGGSNLTGEITPATGTQLVPNTADFFTGTINVDLVPEPSTVVLGLLGGLGALVLLRRRF